MAGSKVERIQRAKFESSQSVFRDPWIFLRPRERWLENPRTKW